MIKQSSFCERKWIAVTGRAVQLRPMRHRQVIAAAGSALALALTGSCDRTIDAVGGTEPAAPGPFAEVVGPAGDGSRTPRFRASPGGILLSWQVEEADVQAVRFAELRGGEWSRPRTIVSRDDLFVNWADYPSVVSLGGDGLAAHWLQHNGPGTYAYQVVLSSSADGGATWSAPLVPHERRTQTEHGFVTLVPGRAGLELIWLDGRAYEEGPREEMSLRAATVPIDPGTGPGAPAGEAVLDARTCDCCQTSAVQVPDGLVVAYRGRSTEEIRDIEVVRRIAGAWTEPTRVHEDGWRIDACPVNGPALAAHGDTVLVAWFTAAGDSARVLAAVSHDGGARFGAPVRIDEGRGLGRVDALPLGAGRFAVAWLEGLVGGGAEIRVRAIDGAGRRSPAVPAGGTSAARASGFPTLALDGGDLLVAWTDADAGRVRIARGPAH